MIDPSFARPAHLLGSDPVLGGVQTAKHPTRGQGLTLDENGAIPAGVLSSTITGQVDASHAVVAGTGFSVSSGGTGLNTITFDAPFAVAPTVIATAFDSTGSRVAHIVSVDTTNVVIQTRQGGGTTSNIAFHFVAYATV